MSCFLVWITTSLIVAALWSWWNRERENEPNQWRRYRGVMHLREQIDPNPPLDTARLVLYLRSGGQTNSAARYSLPEPLKCTGCKRATMLVHRGADGGVRCPSC